MKKINLKKGLVNCWSLIFILFAQGTFAQEVYTLEQCRKLALEQNKKVKIAQEKAQASTALRKSAFTKYLPDFKINAGYLHTNKALELLQHDMFLPIIPYNAIDQQTGKFNPGIFQDDPETALKTLVINPETGKPLTDASGNPVFQQYALLPADQLKLDYKNAYYAGLSVMQPLFTGFKITEAYRIAQYTETIENNNVILTKAELVDKTDEAYWRVVSMNEKVKLAQSYLELLNRLVFDLENLYDEGLIIRNDLLKAQVKQNDAKLKLLKAENGLTLSKMVLAQIMGVESDNLAVADGVESGLEKESLPYLASSKMVDNRVEIAMLKQKVSIAESAQKIATSRFMPDIFLSGGYAYLNPNPYKGFEKKFGGDWNIGVVLSMPIFHWGDRVHTLNAAKKDRQAVQYELDEARELIDLQIRQSINAYTESLDKVAISKLSKEQAKESMDISQNHFNEGLIKLTDLLESQLDWEQASNNYIDAVIEMKIARTELDKATGAIYDYPEMYNQENN